MKTARLMMGILAGATVGVVSGGATVIPTAYELGRIVQRLQSSDAERVADQALFNARGDVVFRLVEGEASRPMFSSADGLLFGLLPPDGYDAVEVRDLGDGGVVVGKATINQTEAAWRWTISGGSEHAAGTDPGYSFFNAVNRDGTAAGGSYFSVEPDGFSLIRWAAPGAALRIPLPPDTDYSEVVEINSSGEVLLFLRVSGEPRPAVFSGTQTALAGGPLPAGAELYPANLSINSSGDVVCLLLFPAEERYSVRLIRASDRTQSVDFEFPRSAVSTFSLNFNSRGELCFGTSSDLVEFLDTASGYQQAFSGYRGYLNDHGLLVYGNQGNLMVWKRDENGGQAKVIPIRAGQIFQAPDILGLNNAGQVLLRLARTTMVNGDALEVFSPVFEQTATNSVRVVARKPVVAAIVGEKIDERVLQYRVEADSPKPEGAVTFKALTKLPKGLRLKARSGKIVGRPRKAMRSVVRVIGRYRVDGEWFSTKPVRIKIRVKPRARGNTF